MLMSFVLFIAIVSVFFRFMHVYNVLGHKKCSNPYSWTHVQEEGGKSSFYLTYDDGKLFINC